MKISRRSLLKALAAVPLMSACIVHFAERALAHQTGGVSAMLRVA